MVFSGYVPRVGLVNHMVTLFFVFQGTSIMFSVVTVSICVPTEMFSIVTVLYTPSFIVFRFGDDDHPGWCTYHLHFSDN